MKSFLAATLLLASTISVGAQPTEMYKCVTWGLAGEPNCGRSVFSVLDACGETLYVFETFKDRATWFPLKNEGAITIEVTTRGGYATGFPLYVAIVPLPDPIPTDYCNSDPPGIVVGYFGGSTQCGGGWEAVGPIDVDTIVPRGGSYALQLMSYWFFNPKLIYYSPAFNCVRVTSSATPVERGNWTRIKSLYR